MTLTGADEAISAPMRGLDVARPLRIVVERATDLANADLECGVADEHVGPDRVEQLLFRHQAPGVLHEVLQHVVGARRERHDLPVTPELRAGAVERARSECEAPVGRGRWQRLRHGHRRRRFLEASTIRQDGSIRSGRLHFRDRSPRQRPTKAASSSSVSKCVASELRMCCTRPQKRPADGLASGRSCTRNTRPVHESLSWPLGAGSADVSVMFPAYGPATPDVVSSSCANGKFAAAGQTSRLSYPTLTWRSCQTAAGALP